MKSVAVLLFLAFFTNSALSRRIQPRNALADIIRNVLESSRSRIANLHLHIDELGLGLLGSAQNLTIENLETFKIEEISVGLPLSLKVNNLTLTLDNVQIGGSYELNNASLPLVGTLNGRGNFSIGLQGVRIFSVLDFKAGHLLQPVLDKIENLIINVGIANALFDGIDGGDATNDLISSVLPDQIRDAVAKLVAKRGQAIVDAINDILGVL